MLEGDVEISTVTILQSLIQKINNTLNDSPCESSSDNTSKCSHEIVNDVHDISSDLVNYVCYQDISNEIDNEANIHGSPAAFEEVGSSVTCTPNYNSVDSNCYETLANYIRELSHNNLDQIIFKQSHSADIKLSDISACSSNNVYDTFSTISY